MFILTSATDDPTFPAVGVAALLVWFFVLMRGNSIEIKGDRMYYWGGEILQQKNLGRPDKTPEDRD